MLSNFKYAVVGLMLLTASACTTLTNQSSTQQIYTACLDAYDVLSALKNRSQLGILDVPMSVRQSVDVLYTTVINPICIVDGEFKPIDTADNLAAVKAAVKRMTELKLGGAV